MRERNRVSSIIVHATSEYVDSTQIVFISIINYKSVSSICINQYMYTVKIVYINTLVALKRS